MEIRDSWANRRICPPPFFLLLWRAGSIKSPKERKNSGLFLIQNPAKMNITDRLWISPRIRRISSQMPDHNSWHRIYDHFCCRTVYQRATFCTCYTGNSPRASACPCTIDPEIMYRFAKKWRFQNNALSTLQLTVHVHVHCISNFWAILLPQDSILSWLDISKG